MKKPLDVRDICRQFTKVLSDQFGDIEFRGDAPPAGSIVGEMTNQSHVAIALSPEEMVYPLEMAMERIFKPAAAALSNHLKSAAADATYHLSLPERTQSPDISHYVARYNGMSVRCIIHQRAFYPAVSRELDGKYQLRFDVVYRRATQSKEAA